jgi:TRAP-type uncharacterized transport system substrate-binding protein
VRTFLTTCAVVLAIVAATLGVVYYVLHPPEFKIAVPATDTLDQRVFGAAADLLRTQAGQVRITVVPFDTDKLALEALEADKVKLAVVRSDTAMQGRAQTLMIMRRQVAVLIAPKTGKVQKISDLSGTMLGVTREGPLDGSLLWPVLDYYGIPREKIKYMPVPQDEIANAFRQKKVDAIIAVGGVASKQMADIVAEAARGVKGAIQFIDIEEADAIAKRIPALESVEVDQGAFGGRPPRPAESFNALGYSIRLVSTQKLDTDTVAEVMRQLYLIRQNIAAAVPGAGLMQAPDTDEATPFLIHPGVRAYVNGETRTFFDRYSDYIYLFMFLGSGLGSVAAGIFGWMSGESEPAVPVERVDAVLDEVRDAKTPEAIDAAERQADEIFRSVFRDGAAGKIAESGLASFGMAMNELRARIAARRAALSVERI